MLHGLILFAQAIIINDSGLIFVFIFSLPFYLILLEHWKQIFAFFLNWHFDYLKFFFNSRIITLYSLPIRWLIYFLNWLVCCWIFISNPLILIRYPRFLRFLYLNLMILIQLSNRISINPIINYLKAISNHLFIPTNSLKSTLSLAL